MLGAMIGEDGKKEHSVEEEGEAGVCYQKAVGKLKAEFETRLAALEEKNE